MIDIREEYVVDESGNRKAVVLPLSTWAEIKEALEEIEDVRAYDLAKREPSNPIDFEHAVAVIREEKVD